MSVHEHLHAQTMTVADMSHAIRHLLATEPGLDVFDGEVNARMDSDGRAHPYAVVRVTAGRFERDTEALDGSPGMHLWKVHVTAAGGDMVRAQRAVDRTLNALIGARIGTGLVRLEDDYGLLRQDTTVKPDRYYSAMVFTVS